MKYDMICNRSEDISLLIPYIDKPVYIKGYCWNKSFDGWVVIYKEKDRLLFDYRGEQYPVFGFLPSRHTMWTDSSYNNAIYEVENDILFC